LVSHCGHPKGPSLLPIVVIVAFLMALSDALPANDYCQFPAVPNTVDGYRMRGDRCEGIHAVEVASLGMVPTSFTYFFEEFANRSPSTMKLSWTASGDDSIVLSGRGMRFGAHYAMDTVAAAGSGTFSWSAEILIRRQFRRAELGFLAWREYESNGQSLKQYVPLGVSHNLASTATQSTQGGVYTFVFRPGKRFVRMYRTLERVCNEAVDVVEERALLNRPYLGTDKVAYALAIPKSVGLYRIRIEGERDDGSYCPHLVFTFIQKHGTVDVPCE